MTSAQDDDGAGLGAVEDGRQAAGGVFGDVGEEDVGELVARRSTAHGKVEAPAANEEA